MVYHKEVFWVQYNFFIYINELPNEIKSDIYMFADDTKVFRTIKTNDDQCILQDDLDELTAWATQWLLNMLIQLGSAAHRNYG